MRSKGSLRQHLPPPPCGARKNLRAARLLDFFDRCGCSASLHPPLAALGSAPPFPSPAAGEGPSIPITACSVYNLGSVTFCYWFAVVPNKIRRRHLESVSAAPYGSTFQLSLKSPIRIQPQLKRYGVLGHSPKRVLVWGPGGTQGPPGKGGAAERWRVTPSVSGVTRHGAQPATTRTYKSRAPAAIRTDRHLLVTPPRRRRPPIWLKNPFSHFSS